MKIGASNAFDYIVIGAGSAGCVVAARLSEDGTHRVALLEAGGEDRNPYIHAPMGYPRLYADPRVNWMYQSAPESGLDDRTIHQPAGKVLGGTSAINGMVYLRGRSADYDRWQHDGCSGWDWRGVLPYFQRAEKSTAPECASLGRSGPLAVGFDKHADPLVERWIEAGMQAGLRRAHDFNSGEPEGVGRFASTIRDGRRASTAVAYLHGARDRQNLTVRTGVAVQRILFEGGHATAVEFLDGNTLERIVARKEIVLCAGTFASPALLQRSGIGPADPLRSLDIPVVHDAPDVGSNLQDHFCIRMHFRCSVPTLNDVSNSVWRRVAAGVRYLAMHSGPLASNGIPAGAYLRSDDALEFPDLQLNFSLFSYASRNAKGAQPHPFSGFSINTCHIRPEARGSLRIRSSDCRQPPELRFNFLQSPRDVRAIMQGVRQVRRIVGQPALAECVVDELFPGRGIESDEALERVVRASGSSNLHAVGTCRMGEDGTAVVDSRLRVHGVNGLRVIDASIMPAVPAANTNAATVMIAEKGVAMMLQDSDSCTA